MLQLFEKVPWIKHILISFAILISIVLLDSVWHPFPLEYHFGWWFLWFQISIYLFYERNWALCVPAWIYLFWITLRGLPWGNNWNKTWKPFWTAFLGEDRIQHWERWSYKSIYSIEMMMNQNIHDTEDGQDVEQQQVDTEPNIVAPPPSNEIQENEMPTFQVPADDQVSSISDMSFDIDPSQLDAIEQQIKENKNTEENTSMN